MKGDLIMKEFKEEQMRITVNDDINAKDFAKADKATRKASKDCHTPLAVSVGCCNLTNHEFGIFYIAAEKIRILVEKEPYEAQYLAETVLAAFERERRRRKATICRTPRVKEKSEDEMDVEEY